MRFFSSLFLALPFAAAAPVQAAEGSLAAIPAQQTFVDISNMLKRIIPQIENYQGDVAGMNNIERGAEQALKALQYAVGQLNSGPVMGLGDAIAVGPVSGDLISSAYKMTNAFSEREQQFKATPQIAYETFRVLDDTYLGIKAVTEAFEAKLPAGISFMVNVFLNRGLMNNIKDARETFKPAGYVEPSARPAPVPQPQQPAPAYPQWQAPQGQPQYATQSQQGQYTPQYQYQPQQQQQAQPQYAPQQYQQVPQYS